MYDMIQRLNGDVVSGKEAQEKAVSALTSAQRQINEQIREGQSQTGQRKPVLLVFPGAWLLTLRFVMILFRSSSL